MIRRHIVFTRSVQGVGFRYRARHAAELYGCTGWVRNEYDGSVVMEIQEEVPSTQLATPSRTQPVPTAAQAPSPQSQE